MVFIFIVLLIALMFTNLGKIAMLRFLQGLLMFIGTFGIFIFAAVIYYYKVTN